MSLVQSRPVDRSPVADRTIPSKKIKLTKGQGGRIQDAKAKSLQKQREIAKDDTKFESFAFALTGKTADERTPQENEALDHLRQEMLEGKIDPEFVQAVPGNGTGQNRLPAGVRGAFVPGGSDQAGRVLLSGSLRGQSLQKASDEEMGEAVADHASQLGIAVADGDAGARVSTVANGGTVSRKSHSDLFTSHKSDSSTVISNGEAVKAETQQAAPVGQSETLIDVQFNQNATDQVVVEYRDPATGTWVPVATTRNERSRVQAIVPGHVKPSDIRIYNDGGLGTTISADQGQISGQTVHFDDRIEGPYSQDFDDVSVTTSAAPIQQTTLDVRFKPDAKAHSIVQYKDDEGNWITVASKSDADENGNVTVKIPDAVANEDIRVVNLRDGIISGGDGVTGGEVVGGTASADDLGRARSLGETAAGGETIAFEDKAGDDSFDDVIVTRTEMRGSASDAALYVQGLATVDEKQAYIDDLSLEDGIAVLFALPPQEQQEIIAAMDSVEAAQLLREADPQVAAAIVTSLPIDLGAEVIARIASTNPAKAADIIAFVEPGHALTILETIDDWQAGDLRPKGRDLTFVPLVLVGAEIGKDAVAVGVAGGVALVSLIAQHLAMRPAAEEGSGDNGLSILGGGMEGGLFSPHDIPESIRNIVEPAAEQAVDTTAEFDAVFGQADSSMSRTEAVARIGAAATPEEAQAILNTVPLEDRHEVLSEFLVVEPADIAENPVPDWHPSHEKRERNLHSHKVAKLLTSVPAEQRPAIINDALTLPDPDLTRQQVVAEIAANTAPAIALMNEADAADLLAKMDPDAAAAVIAEIAKTDPDKAARLLQRISETGPAGQQAVAGIGGQAAANNSLDALLAAEPGAAVEESLITGAASEINQMKPANANAALANLTPERRSQVTDALRASGRTGANGVTTFGTYTTPQTGVAGFGGGVSVQTGHITNLSIDNKHGISGGHSYDKASAAVDGKGNHYTFGPSSNTGDPDLNALGVVRADVTGKSANGKTHTANGKTFFPSGWTDDQIMSVGKSAWQNVGPVVNDGNKQVRYGQARVIDASGQVRVVTIKFVGEKVGSNFLMTTFFPVARSTVPANAKAKGFIN